ncbi:OmpA family protein [Epilithonimonas arachidiradicis]|uniref:Cell envelope biogenesis protein OmpA n=1 Tax=Epilithonimonas arachidiradicis TaxID=1617282 RepID=A0A420DCW4_9FLAO|nr:OmpA family protein [Epilithonimonas arachidiradicis]RKE89487.1 outer membrane protein OmpA-like peptidoglycan-associated protein [Epilithonimonas arachidiradicis]GGG42799.1 cell envelope biogenesis protein OmpA [Epilithonimonas arachidiradicis]
MKNLKLGISALALTVASTVFAQTTTNKWVIGVGAHGVNHVAQRNNFSNTFSFNNFKENLFGVSKYSITPPLSKLTVARSLSKGIVLDWQTTVGNVDNKRFGMDKEFFLMTGLGVQFKAAGLLWDEESWFDPYLRVGANYLRHDYTGLTFPTTDTKSGEVYSAYNKDGDLTGKANHFTVSTGAGINFWVTKNFGLGVQGDYVTTPVDKSSVANFWQASASLLFRFGNTDRDKDGIPDKDDRCPDTPGLPEFQGCPDTDGDGIPDIDDQCPDVAGPKENNGCPWPDTDGDGVLDKDDACVDVPGPAENKGCPWPDTDGDGVLDKDDACPTVPGLPEYQGCPKPASAYATEATGALTNILFDFNKATLRPESAGKINQAAEILKGAKDATFLVTGHTDAKGAEAYNLKLSRQRAASVVAALEAQGVSASQLKSVGVGERDAKVSEKASDAERQADRKVVVEAVNGAAWEALQKSDLPVVEKKVVKKAPAKKKATKKRK